jgi:LmbE family N-acetylglucosaminyl deacetylase
MAKSSAAGHRVLVVCATKGELGEPQPGVLERGENLAERRVVELAESAAILGAEQPRFLEYKDSGMMGEDSNDDPDCFWQADIEEAAKRLAAILTDVDADVLTIYDDHGLYGHPDHIQVHRVGLRAAELAGTTGVYEATVNRDRALESMAEMSAEMEADGVEVPRAGDFDDFGVLENDLAYSVDVSGQLEAKRASMVVHRSQISDQSFFLYMPPDRFAKIFANEWFAVPGETNTGGPKPVELLPGL